jgi:hypothetical protein
MHKLMVNTITTGKVYGSSNTYKKLKHPNKTVWVLTNSSDNPIRQFGRLQIAQTTQ